MAIECVALGLFDLPGGNCADWFAGTMSGFAVAFAAGSYSLSEYRLRREQRERERAVARTIGMKIFRLLTDVNNDLSHLRPKQMPSDLCPFILEYGEIYPIVGITYDTTFALDPLEIDFLTRTGDVQFLSDLMMALSRHRSTVEGLQEYKVRYEALRAMMPTPAKTVGIASMYQLTEEQMLKIAPYIATLNDFLNSTAVVLRENAVETVKLANRYSDVMKKHLRVKKWMSIGLANPMAQGVR